MSYQTPALQAGQSAPGRGEWVAGVTITVTLAQAPTAGNLLIAAVSLQHVFPGLPTVTGIADANAKTVWTQQTTRTADNSGLSTDIWVGVVSAGASPVITVTLSAAPEDGVVDICEWTGLLTVGFLDNSAVNSNAAPDASPDTGTTVNTTQTVELWVGATAILFNTQALPTNGFTLLDGALSALGPVSLAYLYKVVAAIGIANSGTTASGAQFWAGNMTTYKAALSLGGIKLPLVGVGL